MMTHYLTEPLAFTEHQYALIDRVVVPQLPEVLPVIEVVSPLLAPQAHLYPWLLPLRELSSDVWSRLLNGARLKTEPDSPPLFTLLLKSDLSPEAMKNVLVNALYLKEKQQGHILRYYDPRVLFHLHWMMGPWVFSRRIAADNITHWTFWLEGNWHTLAFPEKVRYQQGETSASFAQIQRIGLINQVLAQLPVTSDLAQRQTLSRRIEALFDIAMTQWSLTDKQDLTAFALHGVTLNDEFHQAPRMKELLGRCQHVTGYYQRITRSWTDEQWQEMTSKVRYLQL
ncbi:DUF4123 domain-containing protein [Photorhabdus aegyptia]|uniref:DUF4123 domain-containing protein n=1 Tax=Photorhabdus aegyptia TaxID=2805098 RepID=UPI001E36E010|nr:DUF4123 domain-containing protein [Photorhabdus aegyptia]MCC8457435.1 hypothetical protein [Photorhabdus aegyptia]